MKIVFICLVIAVLGFLGMRTVRWLSSSTSTAPSLAQPTQLAATPTPAPSKPPPSNRTVTGYLVRGRQYIVCLDDGTRLYPEDRRVSQIQPHRVRVDGVWLPVAPKPPPIDRISLPANPFLSLIKPTPVTK